MQTRKQLDHTLHFEGRFGATYFITICCKERQRNTLCHKAVAAELFEAARLYHRSGRWHLGLLLLMPDHFHLLIGIDGETRLSNVVRDFKRISAKRSGIQLQRNYFDHRIRRDERLAQKADCILNNPVGANLVESAEQWAYFIRGDEIGKGD